MKKSIISILCLSSLVCAISQNTASAGDFIQAQAIPDRTIAFSVGDSGVSKPIKWGLDLAWLSESNLRRGIAFMGADKVDVIRASFQPILPLLNGDLQGQQISDLNTRLNLIALTDAHTQVVLNCDHPRVDAYYAGNAANWAQLIDATTRRVQEKGRTVISVSPFNEPDYTATGQGTVTDFYNIASLLKQNSRFNNIRISGGNTLNTDQALVWYNPLKDKLDEGNTHQLAGSFNNYANFYQTVRANGDYATNDELHNVMEAMVGVEYGMQTGIWWGTAEFARGEFVKASAGKRLAYAEHRNNWTAASVYRSPDNKIQAFGGTSERQALTTTYRFVSKDRDVFFDGYGPQREYNMVLPGGTGYQTGQSNAEKVVNITWGDDIQPVINGRYVLVNRMSGKVISVPLGSTTTGAQLRQYTYTGANYQQWNVAPVDSRVGGDFSYYSINAVHSGQAIEVLNFSLDNGATINQWTDNKSSNQQWYLEYAEDGWFYIRSRHSAKCLEAAAPYLSAGVSIQQRDKAETFNQQWRFVPIDAEMEFVAPAAPTNLTTKANSTSIQLNWIASPDADVNDYSVFRAEASGGPYSTIAQHVKSNSYVDNAASTGIPYFYCVKAVDKTLNRSPYSNEVSASTSGNKDLLAYYPFDNNGLDSSINLNHSALSAGVSYAAAKVGTKSILLNGSTAFVQLPNNIANQQEMTIATWIYWRGGAGWQRIFDFGNDQNQYLFLTPNNGLGQMRFTIKNAGAEQQLNATALAVGKWTHVAVTLAAGSTRIFINGVQAAESNSITISPGDIKPILNYIGRSQFADPLLSAYIDDFKVYNYSLSATEVAQIAGLYAGINNKTFENNVSLSIWPIPANDILNISSSIFKVESDIEIQLMDAFGKVVVSKLCRNKDDVQLDVAHVAVGIYVLKLTNKEGSITKKVSIKH